MPAYMIAQIKIDDADAFNEYRRLVVPTIARFDGKVLAADGPVDPLEGDRPHDSTVTIEFPTIDRAQAWYDSDVYAAAKDLRRRASRTNLVFVRGLPSRG